jgi:hypothetical protein
MQLVERWARLQYCSRGTRPDGTEEGDEGFPYGSAAEQRPIRGSAVGRRLAAVFAGGFVLF